MIDKGMIRRAAEGGRPNGAGWVRVDCPVCETRKGTPDSKGSLGYHPESGGFRCFRCDAAGNALPDGERDYLPSRKIAKPTVDIPHAEFDAYASVHGSLTARPAVRYLESRGVTLSDARRADIHVALSGRYNGRVIIPHKDSTGEWWGFTARRWYDADTPKVLYPRGMDRSRMFNDQAIGDFTTTPLLIVEGCFDALPFMPDVVAALGKPTRDHLDLLTATTRPVIVCLDGDAWEDGQAFAKRLALRGVRATFIRMPPSSDPASAQDFVHRHIVTAERTLCRSSSHSPPSFPSSTVHAVSDTVG